MDYMLLYLCRDVYHCRPSELLNENWQQVRRHMICTDEEAKYLDFRRRMRRG